MAEYSIYPFEYMRITQRHDEGNHLPHWYPNADYSDKPFDEACKDGGQSYFVPKNDYKIVEIMGLGTTTTNAVRLQTCNKVIIPLNNEEVILELTLTHMDEACIKKLKVGQIIHKNEKVIWEGKDGATAYHFHCTVNKDKYYGFHKNSNSTSKKEVWVFAYGKSLLPPEAFFIDKSVNVLDPRGYTFKEVPEMEKVGKPVERNTKVDQLKVKVPELRARKTPSLKGDILGYMNEGYYNIEGKSEADGYIWYKVQNMYIAYSKDWEDILPHEETKEEIQIEYKNRILEHIDEFLTKYIEK